MMASEVRERFKALQDFVREERRVRDMLLQTMYEDAKEDPDDDHDLRQIADRMGLDANLCYRSFNYLVGEGYVEPRKNGHHFTFLHKGIVRAEAYILSDQSDEWYETAGLRP